MNERDYEILYDLPAGEYDGRLVEGIRTVTIRAGKSLEVMCHPIMRRWPEAAKREAKKRRTSAAMEKVNARNLERSIMRLMEMNFTSRAMVFTGTFEYPDEEDPGLMNLDDLWDRWHQMKLPEGVEDVRRMVRNFLQRIKNRTENPKDVKWIQRIEEGKKESALGMPPRYHVHMLIEAGDMTQDELSALWPFGFTRCDRFDVKHDGPARLARYMTKDRRSGGRWVSHSRNLKKPEPRVSERTISRRRAMKVAGDVYGAGREILEKLYPDYQLMETPRVTYSDYMPGAYIYARMRRRD